MSHKTLTWAGRKLIKDSLSLNNLGKGREQIITPILEIR